MSSFQFSYRVPCVFSFYILFDKRTRQEWVSGFIHLTIYITLSYNQTKPTTIFQFSIFQSNKKEKRKDNERNETKKKKEKLCFNLNSFFFVFLFFFTTLLSSSSLSSLFVVVHLVSCRFSFSHRPHHIISEKILFYYVNLLELYTKVFFLSCLTRKCKKI